MLGKVEMKPRSDKKGKAIDIHQIPLEIQRDAVALKAFLKDLYRKGYSRINFRIPDEIRKDPVRMMAFWKTISDGKGRTTVKMTVPPGDRVYGTFTMQTPDGVVSMPISHANIGLLKDAITGHKSRTGGSCVVEKRFGTEADRRKERARWQARMSKVYGELLKVDPDKRPSHSMLSRIVGLHFDVPAYKIRRYTRHPDS